VREDPPVVEHAEPVQKLQVGPAGVEHELQVSAFS